MKSWENFGALEPRMGWQLWAKERFQFCVRNDHCSTLIQFVFFWVSYKKSVFLYVLLSLCVSKLCSGCKNVFVIFWGLGSGMVSTMQNCFELPRKKRGRMCRGSEKEWYCICYWYVRICFPCFTKKRWKVAKIDCVFVFSFLVEIDDAKLTHTTAWKKTPWKPQANEAEAEWVSYVPGLGWNKRTWKICVFCLELLKDFYFLPW